jgi:hypothetical protein
VDKLLRGNWLDADVVSQQMLSGFFYKGIVFSPTADGAVLQRSPQTLKSVQFGVLAVRDFANYVGKWIVKFFCFLEGVVFTE